MQKLIDLAIDEDLGQGDVTSDALVSESSLGEGVVYAKQELVVSGLEVLKDICMRRAKLEVEYFVRDGQQVTSKEEIIKVTGSTRSILSYERVMLNFLQRLSGVATITRELVNKTKIEILDTRKTTPGFRLLEKKAVLDGGASNHRIGLFDKFLIKNNHIDCSSLSISELVNVCRAYNPSLEVEIEVRNQVELEAAIKGAPDWILLDNYSIPAVREALKVIPENIRVELSGGITPESLPEYSEFSRCAVSMGYLTHSAKAVDISMAIRELQ